MSAVEALLRRERAVVGAGLALLALLAWVYVWQGAGMDMSALDMTRLALFPHLAAGPAAMADMANMENMQIESPAFAWPLVVAMWWVMMIAMMTPSAAPLVLLYGRVLRRAGDAGAASAYAPSAFLVAGYLAVWLAFSVAAAALQHALQPALVSETMFSSTSAVLSATLLLAAGAYQLSPLKGACLRQCRSPVGFLTRRWRPGWRGAFAMGVEHGAWCVGCCALLMALLFVGGVMNLAWIALLAILVAVEKLAPAGPVVGKAAGVALIGWGVATLLV